MVTKVSLHFIQFSLLTLYLAVEIVRFAGEKIEQEIDKHENAKKYKDTGKKYVKKGVEVTNKALNVVVDAGRVVGKKAYEYTKTEEFKRGWKNTVDGTKSAAKSIGGYISSLFTNENENENENPDNNADDGQGHQPVDLSTKVPKNNKH